MTTFSSSFISFSQETMKTQADQVKKYAAQSENLVLQQLAKEVLKAAGENHAKK